MNTIQFEDDPTGDDRDRSSKSVPIGPSRPAEESDEIRRLGPLERAIRLHRGADWHEEAKGRCKLVETEHGTCWIWQGNRRQNGYGSTGRLGTQRLVHRVSAWATLDFAGKLPELPHVHHRCVSRLCINPEHLQFASAMSNALEQSVRNAVVKLVKELQIALTKVDPGNPLVNPALAPNLATDSLKEYERRSESDRLRTRRIIKTAAWEAKLLANQRKRFLQVLEVQKLMSRGIRQAEALERVGMSRTTFDSWRARLREVLTE